MSLKTITLEDVKKAREVVRAQVHHTPLELSRSCSDRAGTQIYLKYENQQRTGSFKIRGAFNKISQLTAEQKAKGIVASSAGNHAQGVAYSASRLGVRSHIVMPVGASLVKVMATRAYGAEVIQRGDNFDQAFLAAKDLESEKGYVFVHAYEDSAIIAGQGTIGLEIFESVSDFDSLVIPIGGGGLISGIATVAKALNPSCKIFGVQTAAVPSIVESFKKKELTIVDRQISTIADGIAVKKVSAEMFEKYITRLVDDVASVNEDDIADAIVFMMERGKSIIEGSAATALAAALNKKFPLGKKSCVLLSGGNIDLNLVSKVIERGLKKNGRLENITVAVEDKPGSLGKVASILAQKRANILQVYHDRGSDELYLNETGIEFALETSGWEHLREIKDALTQAGCRLLR